MFHVQPKKQIVLPNHYNSIMTKTVLWVLVLATGISLQAQTQNEEQRIKGTIDTFFKALHNGDSTLMATVLHKELKVQTTGDNREGKSFLRTESRQKLLQSIARKKSEDTYFEKLLSYQIKIDGNLASVWTPYEFYYNGAFSHCGANSFQLYNNNGAWEIIYLVDMRRRRGCQPSESKK